MNAESFLEESISYLKDEYLKFQEHQKMVFEIFLEFKKICERHDLKYFCSYGTLLGIVRDGGMVPWDNDMDVCVPVEESELLIQRLKEELPEKYFLAADLIKDHADFHLRIGIVGYHICDVFLDIFYAFGVPRGCDVSSFRKAIIRLYEVGVASCTLSGIKATGSWVSKIRNMFYLFRHGKLWSEKRIKLNFKKLCAQSDYEHAETICIMECFATDYKKCDIEPLQTSQLYGHPVMIPNHPKNILNRDYKNYTEYLPISARFDEFYRSQLESKRQHGENVECDYVKIVEV